MKDKIINRPVRLDDVEYWELYGDIEKELQERSRRLQARRWHMIRTKMTTDGMAKERPILHKVG